ncbi:peptidoglycan-associated lipoprotein Pal [Kordiimonas pumila]|uniref:Peptidoglycan-associated lipoprotein n=1 Tax=Kordiimonas pumila TaxID=2161677 RepID=A0ABV7D8R6_9PROT|nr:peptidoglycan-associated lipoprotein Pal [Kordiimonas pumila]
MISVKLGKNVACITLAALLVVACSKDPKPTPTVSAPAEPVVREDSGTPESVRQAELEAMELQKWGGATQNGVAVYAGADRIFFEYDSSELTADARSTLAKQAEWLMHYSSVKVTVEGHCDERGTREYNLALGDRRATAVKNYLIALGVPSSRLKTISYGKERPAVVGDYAQNRRGVLVVN